MDTVSSMTYAPETLAPYRRRPSVQARRMLHRLIDPVRSWPQYVRAAQTLANLPDGPYRAPVNVPYVAQFASPDLIYAYIHEHLHGRDDPNWLDFGIDDPDTYTFWAHRACAIACLKMAIDGFSTSTPLTMWELVDQGIALGGYRTHDETGTFIDEGWYYPALVKLAEAHGLEVRGMGYVSTLDVCTAIREGWLVAAAVTPDLGERGRLRRYDGHFVVVYEFAWSGGRMRNVTLHNPSGRYPELRAGAIIPARRFARAFAHRFLALRPA
ncbi:MAG TPA: hypothetical protein VMT24_11505 [Aggregatilineaceae bacterium]|nr:hypothetical protein [Aggregatilineaceae bacterium]